MGLTNVFYYGRINLSKGIDVAKSNSNKLCKVCCYWYFRLGFKFQYYICNGCHDLTMLCHTLGNVAIITVKGVGYA